MKVTRYFQSCLLVEEGSARILIDPSGQDADIDKFGKVHAVLYTHEHGDHFDKEMAREFMNRGLAVYANGSTAKHFTTPPTIAVDGQEFDVAGVKLRVMELPHCLMSDGNPGPQNSGYLLNAKLFHPGDGIELDGLQVENLALPITGPDISFKDARSFAIQVKAKNIIPIHYDYIGTKPEVFQSLAGKGIDQITILSSGSSAEI
jgi:L-ascorbate metabolism protein UlaG (beta-lactamase superfamily)